MNLRSLGAWATAGVALWVSLGVIDVAGASAGNVRVAMLPSPLLLPVAVALGLLAGWAVLPRPGAERPTDALLPLYGLWLLVLPYLPWLPDALPVVRVFAGPARYLIWLIVIAQVIWAALGAGRGRHMAVRARGWSTRRAFLIVLVAAATIFAIAFAIVGQSGMFPGGDEPHYLVMAQSLLQDGDLSIENNHDQQDYRAYYAAKLAPHSLARGVDGGMYSVHPIGLPLLVAPAFALGGYKAVVALMLIMAAVAAALTWLWVRQLTGSVSAATFASAAPALSVPYVFSAGTVYPEVAAAAAVMLVFAVGLTTPTDAPNAPGPAPSTGRALLIAAAAGLLPWLSSKYAVLSAVLVAIAIRRVLADPDAGGSRARRLAVLCGPYAVSVAAWFAYFQVTWGSPWPSAAYGGAAHTQMALTNLPRGVPGLLFDQEYGVFCYAPVLAIAVAGWWHQVRAGGPGRWLAVEVGAAFVILLATVAGHTMWWGGTSVPARFLVSTLLLLALPVAWEYRRVATSPDRRATYRLLLLLGLAASVAVLMSPDAAALANRRDGVSRLLQWLSPDWHLWAFWPDFIGQSRNAALAQVAVWFACLSGTLWVVSRALGSSPRGSAARLSRGRTFLRADLAVTTAVLLVTLLTPVVLRTDMKPDVNLADRSRVALLDSFDPRARPLAIRYRPFAAIEARTVPALFDLSARPGARRAVHAVPLFFNARFALPAGRYRITLAPRPEGPARLGGSLRLRGGRHGGILMAWQIDALPGRPWVGTFNLPVDINFVGFQASADLAAAAGEMQLVPIDVVPALERTASNEVLGAMTLAGRYVVLLHDGGSYPEDHGFWVRGEAESAISIVAAEGRIEEPVTLRVRNGPRPNVVRVVTLAGDTEFTLGPSESRLVDVSPTPLDGTVRLTIRPAHGFVPARTEPGSRDERVLGCWVEIAG